MPAKLEDVARRAGVSIATVSRVLADKPYVSERVRERVLAVAAELNYRPSRVARSLRARRARVIGLLISDIRDLFFTSLVRAVEDIAYTHRYSFLLCNTDEDPDKTSVYVDLMRAEHVAGVILVPVPGAESAYRRLADARIPVVTVERRLPAAGLEPVAADTVVLDHASTVETLVLQLIEAGHRRIGAVLAHDEGSGPYSRQAGYLRALADHGLPAAPELICTGPATAAFGRCAAAKLLDLQPAPTALYVGAHLLTLGVLQTLVARRLAIPDDVAVAAVDELDCSLEEPESFGAGLPTYAMGEVAANLLLARIADASRPPQEVVLQTQAT
jgi:DNA-binding LacI/PurR family transcriptional regulator